MFNKILLATDGSKHALRAAEKAKFFTKNIPLATIEIVYVIDAATSKSDVLHHQDQTQIEKKRNEKLKPTIDLFEGEGVNYNLIILHGEPGPVIVDYANKQGIDLVVIGSRGLNSLQEMVLGSVSHKVAKRVNCPVLIVK
jgi:nucleotide-binding universal stress UspA family protein